MGCAAEQDDAVPEAISILLVEDEILIRLMAAEEFRQQGYLVIEARNGEEALAVIDSDVRIHLVFTDVRMPGLIDGIDLARLIRARNPRLPILMASGHLKPADVSGLVDEFFPKPYDPVAVAEHIKRRFEPDPSS